MSGDSEEKVLPPTEHKLRKAREKGQVASSEDFVGGVVVTSAVLYLFFSWKPIITTPAALFEVSVLSVDNSDPLRGLAIFLTIVLELGQVMLPLLITMIIAGIAANILHKQGIPFSLEPIKPDFNKINPGEGLKKLFSRRNASEFGVSFLRIVIWFAASGLVLWLFLPALLASITCGNECSFDVAMSIGLLIIATAVIMLIVTGLLDLPMQVFLFRHEQKMGHKELKREQKDIYGAPEFKGHRKQEHQRLVEVEAPGEGGTGRIRDGALGMSIVLRGFDSAIGIYFHREHCDVPKVVKKFRPQDLVRDMKAAEDKGIEVIHDGALVSDIQRVVEEGGFIKERHFERVARYLVQAGIIS